MHEIEAVFFKDGRAVETKAVIYGTDQDEPAARRFLCDLIDAHTDATPGLTWRFVNAGEQITLGAMV